MSPGTISLYLLKLAAISVLISLVWEKTRRSVLLAVLFHMSFNVSESYVLLLLPEPGDAQRLEIYVLGILVFWTVAITGLLWLRRKSPQSLRPLLESTG